MAEADDVLARLKGMPSSQGDAGAALARMKGGEDDAPSALGSFFRSLLTGAGETALGAAKFALGRRGAQPEARSPGEASAISALGRGAEQLQRANPQDAVAHPLASGLGRFAGQVLPTLPLGAGPRAATLPGRLFQGGMQGAIGAQTDPSLNTPGQRLGAAGLGAAAGSVIPALGSATRTIRPQAQQLMNAGVPLTPGQQSGGLLQRAERRMTAVPVLGDYLLGKEGRSIDGFDRAVVNDAVAPFGLRFGRTSGASMHEVMDEAESHLSKRYDAVYPGLVLTEDAELSREIGRLRDLVSDGGEDLVNRFNSILSKRVDARFGKTPPAPPHGASASPPRGELGETFSIPNLHPVPYNAPINRSIDGETFKLVERDLDRAIRMNRLQGGAGAQVADSIRELRSILHKAVARQNPGVGDEMKALDLAWAKLSRVREAVEKGDAEGRFTPQQLRMAIGQAEKRFSTWNFATGHALLQDWAKAGEKIMGKPLPPHMAYRGPFHEAYLGLRSAPSALTYGAMVGAGGVGQGARAVAPFTSAPFGRGTSRRLSSDDLPDTTRTTP